MIPLLKTLQWLPISFNVKAEILTTAYKTLQTLRKLQLSTIQRSSLYLSPLSSSTTHPLSHSTPGTLASWCSSNTNFRSGGMLLAQGTSYSLYQVCPSRDNLSASVSYNLQVFTQISHSKGMPFLMLFKTITPQQSEFRRNIPYHNKGHLWKTHS